MLSLLSRFSRIQGSLRERMVNNFRSSVEIEESIRRTKYSPKDFDFCELGNKILLKISRDGLHVTSDSLVPGREDMKKRERLTPTCSIIQSLYELSDFPELCDTYGREKFIDFVYSWPRGVVIDLVEGTMRPLKPTEVPMDTTGLPEMWYGDHGELRCV